MVFVLFKTLILLFLFFINLKTQTMTQFNIYTTILVLLLSGLSFLPCHAQWVQLNDAPFETDHSNGFGFNGKGYIIKGSPDDNGNQSQNQLWEYDPVSDSWSQIGYVDGQSRGFAIGDDMNDKYYFGFGNGRNDLWEFDPTDNSFNELPSCPCETRGHPAFVAHENKIYVGAGSGEYEDLKDWWVFDMATQGWSQKMDIPGPDRHHPYQFGIGDEIFVGGGHEESWSKFNIYTETWTAINNFPEGRVAGTQFSYNGIGFVLSGDLADHGPVNDKEFLMYYPDEDEWYELPFEEEMHRWAPSSFIIGNELFYFGGFSAFGDDDSDMWKFDLNAIDCVAPSSLYAVDITDDSAGLFFNGSPSGPIDILQWRQTGTTDWNSIINPTAVHQLNDLEPCTTYEFRLSVDCTDNSVFSTINSFVTTGCGACLDFNYCPLIDEYLALNCFINRVQIETDEFISGNDEGYQEFTSSSGPEVFAGQTFYLEVEPGYEFFAENSYLKVWIDFNGDGNFDNNEIVVNETSISQTYSNNIEIPMDAIIGLSRMRIILDINQLQGPCDGSLFYDGEVEDYCIKINEMPSSNTAITKTDEISIYPNPTNGQLNIGIENEETLDISIYDLDGKIIREGLDNHSSIDVSELANGVYVVKIISEEFTSFKKLVKQ